MICGELKYLFCNLAQQYPCSLNANVGNKCIATRKPAWALKQFKA